MLGEGSLSSMIKGLLRIFHSEISSYINCQFLSVVSHKGCISLSERLTEWVRTFFEFEYTKITNEALFLFYAVRNYILPQVNSTTECSLHV